MNSNLFLIALSRVSDRRQIACKTANTFGFGVTRFSRLKPDEFREYLREYTKSNDSGADVIQRSGAN
ncbi:MAG TPA: hypothetical protein VN861_02275 [Candidatus Acidoferrales bacterium]|jgi:hypothetical protein|nr:hypothetical protein [Candidatus Acidoferrales bacterium]